MPEVEQATWKQIDVRLRRTDGALVEMSLLRPVEWIEQYGLRVGEHFALVLSDIPVDGDATVIDIRPCPPIAEGTGQVVIGRFKTHQVSNLVEVTLENGTTFTGTDMHPAWLPDDEEWVTLEDLQSGGRLETLAGPVAVETVVKLERVFDVYNIETHGHHVYRITDDGVLVHNNTTCPKPGIEGAPTRAADPNAVVNALSDFQSRKFFVNGQNLLLDKSGMKHFLQRHHPKYWNGTIKVSQSFFRKNMSIEEIQDAIGVVLKQNSDRIREIGTNRMGGMTGVFDGVSYQLGLNRGRIGQFFPLKE